MYLSYLLQIMSFIKIKFILNVAAVKLIFFSKKNWKNFF